MQERIDKIIEFLLKEITHLTDPLGLNLEKVSQKLLKKGYTEPEIHKAVEWVIMNLNDDQFPAARTKGKSQPSLRVLIADELHFFTPAAYGYLIQLQTLGIANALQVEQIIERCFLMGFGRIDINEIKTVVSQILLGRELGTFDTDAVYYPGNDKLN